jgi:DNA-binding protein H-NS
LQEELRNSDGKTTEEIARLEAELRQKEAEKARLEQQKREEAARTGQTPDVKPADGKTPEVKPTESKTPEVKPSEVKTPEVKSPTGNASNGQGANAPRPSGGSAAPPKVLPAK